MRHHLTLIRMAAIKNKKKKKKREKIKNGEDVEKLRPLCPVGGNIQWCNHCGKQEGVTFLFLFLFFFFHYRHCF